MENAEALCELVFMKKESVKTSIYLVRHGQTAWNREEIFRGRTDVPLNEIGMREAELAGGYLKDKEIHVIYSSPLSRAWQTAQKIAQFHHLEVQPLNGIIDMSFGRWEGHSLQEIQKNDGELYRQWREEPHLVRITGGESLDEVRIRTMAALDEVIQKHPGKTLVLVTHRVVNKVMICGILGLDNSHFWQIAQDTTAINLIQHRDGKYVLSLMNETCHLKALKEERLKIDF
jgi:broad specificity phosphatase PhoE